MILLKSGKPPSFDREFFEWLAVRSRQGLDHLGLMRDRPYFAPPRGKPLSGPSITDNDSSQENNHGKTN
ncbi:MAG: hypothetical protein R3F19_12655 [Verrucomicrobiales bacterium]